MIEAVLPVVSKDDLFARRLRFDKVYQDKEAIDYGSFMTDKEPDHSLDPQIRLTVHVPGDQPPYATVSVYWDESLEDYFLLTVEEARLLVELGDTTWTEVPIYASRAN